MTSEQQIIRSLLDAPEFTASLEAALSGRITNLSDKLRYHARNGESVAAAGVVGQLDAYSGLTKLLDSFTREGNKGGSGK